MFKRIFAGILSATVAATMLLGCSFFTHDNERDYQQIAAQLESYTIENSVRVPDGDDKDKTEVKKYVTEPKSIYKYDLVQYVNNNYSSLSQSYGTTETLFKAAINMLVSTEIVVNEADALIDAGLIEWGITEQNTVKKRIYSVIDNSLTSIQNTLLESRDKPTIDTSNDDESSEPTYPTPSEKDDESDVKDTEEWKPSLSSYPGLYGDGEQRSLERESMHRFIATLKNRVKDDFRVTAEDRAKFDKDIEDIDNVINTQGVEQVYPMLGSTHLVYYVSGKNIERSQKIYALQSYLSDRVTVSHDEVQASYTATLNEQKSLYTADPSAFDSAISGSTTVLYYPEAAANYFYVKHILLPFSDEQKAELEEYSDRMNVTEDQVNAFRDRLVDNIVCYPHKNGEDDKSKPMTVDQVMNDIRAKMTPLAADVKAADRTFDDLIYLYNTDPGAFGNNKGYIVKYKLKEGENETYMQEFADAARYMRDNIPVGEVYYKKVVTSYGVHIMYMASTLKLGAVALYEYTTPGEVETYFDVLKEPIKTQRVNNSYSSWEDSVLNYNIKQHATLYEDRYSDFWK